MWKGLWGGEVWNVDSCRLTLGCKATVLRFVAIPWTCELTLRYQEVKARSLPLVFTEGSSCLYGSVQNYCFLLESGFW